MAPRAGGLATIALQVGIQLSGNRRLQPRHGGARGAAVCADVERGGGGAERGGGGLPALYAFLSLLHFPHNSYTTQAWPFAVSSDMVDRLPPPPARRRASLALARALAPWHVCHAWGVFTPLSPFYCTDSRPLLDLLVSSDGKKWRPLLGRYHADAHGLGLAGTRSGRHPTMRALRWFAPHQPRLDHHLFYEAMRIDLAETTLLNPYHAYGVGRCRGSPIGWWWSRRCSRCHRGVRARRRRRRPTSHLWEVGAPPPTRRLAAGAWRPAPGPPNLRGEARCTRRAPRCTRERCGRSTAGPSRAARRAAAAARRLPRERRVGRVPRGAVPPGSFDLFAHPAAEEACLYTKRELTLDDDAEELAALRKWHVCRVE